ncbi:tyrosine-type recombinase/integrase [Anoxybacillus flavithermus]|uniref:tyrosine-type recombinase/integrase n=1 Tax=Anoxybacillus flavithermus TaxID=33934 RepID=UPI001869431D|nr:tyrosine-type recombinase/integrase [Anoxybacillus flavithermus]MBE2914148.1 tyrosine-type recombinase/integrase [Anoxybacillus flavithermus]
MIQQFAQEALRGKSKETIKTYCHALEQFSKWLEGAGTDLQHYSRMDVQQYIDFLASRGKSVATINKIWNAIKKFSIWANKEQTIEDIFVVKPRNILHEAPKALERNEVNRLLREIDRTGNLRDMAIAQLLINTGIRLSELVASEKTDVTISQRKGEVIIRKGKGAKERKIPLNSETRRAITKYLEQRTDDNSALFLSNRNKQISPRTVQHIFQKYGVNVHALRHTFITRLVRNREDISIIQALSGHSSADMVLRYSAPTDEDKMKAVSDLWIK